MSAKKLRIAAVGDLHYGKASQGLLQPLMAQMATTRSRSLRTEQFNLIVFFIALK